MDINQLNKLKSENDKAKRYFTISIVVFAILVIGLQLSSFSGGIRARLQNPGIYSFLGPIVGFCAIGAFIATFVTILAYQSKNRKYRKAYKEYFSKKVLETVLDEYTYSPDLGIDKQSLRDLGCIRFGNSYKTEDLVSGMHKNVKISQADLTISYEGKKDEPKEIYFKGRWTIADYPKKFESKLIIVGRQLHQFVHCPSGFHKIEVESIEFNKRFTIYAKDGREMFYLLNPKIIERMQQLAESSSNYLVFIFDNQKLHIGISAPNSFEPPRTKGSLDEAGEIKRLTAETSLIAKLIDELDLDKKLFVA